MSRYKVKVGEDFEIKTVTVELVGSKPAADIRNSERFILALIILGFIGFFLLGAALIGFYEGGYGKLQAVYNVAAIPATAILSFYFKSPSDRE